MIDISAEARSGAILQLQHAQNYLRRGGAGELEGAAERFK
jgi:hypothetical protein